MHEKTRRSGFNHVSRFDESVLCMVIAFLLLLSCPVIKTIEALISGSEYAGLNHTPGLKKVKASAGRIVADTCSSLDELMSEGVGAVSFNAKLSHLPVALVAITVFAIVSHALQAAYQRDVFTRISASAFPTAEIPIYIKHRLLLI